MPVSIKRLILRLRRASGHREVLPFSAARRDFHHKSRDMGKIQSLNCAFSSKMSVQIPSTDMN